MHLVFEASQTKVVHFCFCLVRIKMPLLRWSGSPFKENSLKGGLSTVGMES